ncbi:MAG: hypothetical protein II740_02540, partial [Lachnospiraceae bacterium]|nr:hypothetical protein [Lachnospiraceae bacterium]
MFQKEFSFCLDKETTKRGCVQVNPSDLYSPETGYGFVTKENREKQELLQIPALSNGFIPMDIESDRPIPTSFKCDVLKQGNYLVEIDAENDGTQALIFLERRRLYYIGNFKGKKTFSFCVNVCDIIPEFKEKLYYDKDLDITWIGKDQNDNNGYSYGTSGTGVAFLPKTTFSYSDSETPATP